MNLSQRLQQADSKRNRRSDNDPELCALQSAWIRKYGESKQSYAQYREVHQQFQNDASMPLAAVCRQYGLGL